MGNFLTRELNSSDGTLSTVSPLPVFTTVDSAGNISVTTAATGTNWTAFASAPLKRLFLSNQTGTILEVQQGGTGVGFQIPTGTFFTFCGINNANQLSVRRVDTTNTQVTATARWER